MTGSVPGIDSVTSLVREAGEEILRWYQKGVEVEEKEDSSPITAADRAAHQCLTAGLRRLDPSIPVLSEESGPEEVAERGAWKRFWLVDPLDGTKEFLKGTDEFTVNVALVESGRAVMGIVHAPALDRLYRAADGASAEMSVDGGTFHSMHTRRFDAERPILVASRDHAGPGIEAFATSLGPGVEFTSMGSALKFCLVAEGKADLYLRDGPTMEWDTAAAQCVVERAGGGVFSLEGSTVAAPLTYNKRTLRNPHFICVGDPAGSWRNVIQSVQIGG